MDRGFILTIDLRNLSIDHFSVHIKSKPFTSSLKGSTPASVGHIRMASITTREPWGIAK